LPDVHTNPEEFSLLKLQTGEWVRPAPLHASVPGSFQKLPYSHGRSTNARHLTHFLIPTALGSYGYVFQKCLSMTFLKVPGQPGLHSKTLSQKNKKAFI
jgi:hypothetical protein